MKAFRRMFVVAGLAGLVAGLVLATAHVLGTVPIILEAETYEEATGSEATSILAANAAHRHEEGAVATSHDHAEDAWAPRDGLERGTLTVAVDILTAIGFGLMLVAAYELAGGKVGTRDGLYWGLAGFVTFTLAPSIGLPPELPGTEAAPLPARQAWWLATVAATGVGLAFVFVARAAIWTVAGLLLLVVPHLYGAPQPAQHGGVAPASLAHDFVTMVLVTNLVFWATLGAMTGYLFQRSGDVTGFVPRDPKLSRRAV